MSRPLALVLFLATGCDAIWTAAPSEREVFDGPIEGLSGAQLATFFAGDEAFGEAFTRETGLGPIFNAPSCISCHPGDGKGHPSTNLIRFGRGDGSSAASFNYLEDLGGPQLQDRAIPGYKAEVLPADAAISARGGPVVTGLGLLEAVPADTILALEDPDDGDGDGVSGRANFIVPPEALPADCACEGCRLVDGQCRVLGRFGRKATSATLLQQASSAYHDDMGITSDLRPDDLFNPTIGGPTGDEVADPEVSSDTLHNVTFYLQTLRPPARRTVSDAEVRAGEQLFVDIGCAACHVPALPTGASPIDPLSHTTAFAYSDMLLHDMGHELADGFPEGLATGREWRTTPLWGLGIIAGQLGEAQFYMHDGRARTLESAILMHGGEARGSAERFEALGTEDQRRLVTFLRSL